MKNSSNKKESNPSSEQKVFAEKAIKIFTPIFENFEFKKELVKIEKYSSEIVFKKNDLYVKISGTTYPTDYPYSYNIILGEGSSSDFYEYDWNSIALWKLINEKEKSLIEKEFDFPFEEKVALSLKDAKSKLLKYASDFLNGDLELFYKIRKEQNKLREPYKIYSTDKDGNRIMTYDPKSQKQKDKYS